MMTVGEYLGEGAFGVVHKGVWGTQPVAIKTIKIGKQQHDEISREVVPPFCTHYERCCRHLLFFKTFKTHPEGWDICLLIWDCHFPPFNWMTSCVLIAWHFLVQFHTSCRKPDPNCVINQWCFATSTCIPLPSVPISVNNELWFAFCSICLHLTCLFYHVCMTSPNGAALLKQFCRWPLACIYCTRMLFAPWTLPAISSQQSELSLFQRASNSLNLG